MERGLEIKQNQNERDQNGNGPRRGTPWSRLGCQSPESEVDQSTGGHEENHQDGQQEKKHLEIGSWAIHLSFIACVLREPKQHNNNAKYGEQLSWWRRNRAYGLACPSLLPLWTPPLWIQPIHLSLFLFLSPQASSFLSLQNSKLPWNTEESELGLGWFWSIFFEIYSLSVASAKETMVMDTCPLDTQALDAKFTFLGNKNLFLWCQFLTKFGVRKRDLRSFCHFFFIRNLNILITKKITA